MQAYVYLNTMLKKDAKNKFLKNFFRFVNNKNQRKQWRAVFQVKICQIGDRSKVEKWVFMSKRVIVCTAEKFTIIMNKVL